MQRGRRTEEREGDLVTLAELARRVGAHRSALGRQVKRLGLRFFGNPRDRREKLVSIREYERAAKPVPEVSRPSGAQLARVRIYGADEATDWFERVGGLGSPSVGREIAVHSGHLNDDGGVDEPAEGEQVGGAWKALADA